MAQVSVLPIGLSSHLEHEKLAWAAVWKPLRKAAENNETVECEGNAMIFGYEPTTKLYTVATTFGTDLDVQLSKEDFIREVGKYTRGAP